MAKKSERTMILEETERLNFVFHDIPEDKRAVVQGLIERCAFMRIALQKLENEMQGQALTETYQHGKSQTGEKVSANLQAHTLVMKQYTTAIKALVALIPARKEAGQETQKTNALMLLLEKSKEAGGIKNE